MTDLLFATSNPNKVLEARSILKEINIISLSDINDQTDVEETGETFSENALLKAKTFSLKYNLPVIADDSGLVVEALNGRPGIYSRRYSGKGDIENNLKILDEMKDIKNRDAHFVAAVVLYFPNGVHYYQDQKYPRQVLN